MSRTLRVATRASELAFAQTQRVVDRLGVRAEIVTVSTRGDRDQASSLHDIGGTGVFVKEVQAAVARGDADIAVHSAKDLPAVTPPELVLAAIPERLDPRDAVVGSRLDDLPSGATVATGSTRRRAQIALLYGYDLHVVDLRGNIPTRLARASEFDAVIVAVAALQRLGRTDAIAEILEPMLFCPQVGQGALAVECRADDHETRAVLSAIDDPEVSPGVHAERAFLAELGGGCELPCGALAEREGDELALGAILAAPNGAVVLRSDRRGSVADPVALGREVARDLLARGADEGILDLLNRKP